MDRLEELVYLAIGRAQMCWKEFPAGEPDDDRAYEIGKQLIATIRKDKEEEPVQQPALPIFPYAGYPYPYNPLLPPYRWISNTTKEIKVTWNAENTGDCLISTVYAPKAL